MGGNAKPRPCGRVLRGGLPFRKFPTFSEETVAVATLNIFYLFSLVFFLQDRMIKRKDRSASFTVNVEKQFKGSVALYDLKV